MKFLIFICLNMLIFFCNCSQKIASPQKCDFNFDLCHATYKGKPIPFDKPLSEWVNLFGKYNRSIDSFSYVWDSIGINLRKSNFSENGKYSNKEKPDELFICFTNLNSPLGKAGKLQFATNYESYEHIIQRNEEGGYVYSAAGKLDLKEQVDKNFVTKYEYPLKIYSDTVRADGAIVANGMSLKEINNYRTEVKGNETFGYWDRDGNAKNERGSTNVKTGEFIDFDIEGEKSPCGIAEKYYFKISLRYTEGVLEYVKVERVAKGKSFYW